MNTIEEEGEGEEEEQPLGQMQGQRELALVGEEGWIGRVGRVNVL